MKNLINKSIKYLYIVIPIAVFLVMPMYVSAFLQANFIPNPLFSHINILPGTKTTGTIEITNGFQESRNVYIEAINVFDTHNLGSQMKLVVSENETIFYDGSLQTFLTSGKYSLGSVAANGSKTYKLEVEFLSNAGDSYQKKSLGFDICVGFSGGQIECGETVVGPENPTPNGGGGGGGGGGGQSSQLIIFNEQSVAGVPQDTSAIITWNTNKLATSQVIYGLASGAPYTLNLNAPNFGYPLGTTETSLKVITHNVPLSGLTNGETYVYRVVSRASPATISPEYRFTLGSGGTITLGPIALGSAPSAPSLSSDGTGSGESNGVLELDSDPEIAQETEQFAAALFAGFPSLSCITWALLIFLVIWLLSKVFFRTEEGTGCKRRGFVVLMTLIASIILWLIPYACPILSLWIVLIIYVVWTKISDRKRAKTSKGV